MLRPDLALRPRKSIFLRKPLISKIFFSKLSISKFQFQTINFKISKSKKSIFKNIQLLKYQTLYFSINDFLNSTLLKIT